MSRVLIIGDTHIPYEHKDYLSFCKKIHKEYKCNKVVHIGDVSDMHALSYHESNPNLPSAGDELKMVRKKIKPWLKAFPKAKVCIGNHCALPFRKAMTAGIPPEMMLDYAHIYETPGWDWGHRFEIDGVQYFHGKGSGKLAALNAAILERSSIVMGHLHSQSGVKYTASHKDRLFAVDTGCGIDIKHPAFAYGANMSARPILSCAVVIDGWLPHVIPMRLK